MKYRFAISILCLTAIAATPVFMQAEPQTPSPDVKPAAQEEPPPVLAVPPGYRYDSRGRRDPFVNPIPKPVEPSPAEVLPPRPPGIKGALVNDVGLLGVLVSKDDASLTRAVLQVPGMKAPVMVVRGDVLFDAVIKEIRPDAVVFTLAPPGNKPKDPSGNTELVKKVRSTAGDKK